MTPEQFAQEAKSGKLKPVYFLFGEDAAARGAAVKALKASVAPDPFNLNELDAESAEEAVSAANTPPVFSDRRLVLVRGSRMPAEARRALAEYLADPLPSTTLVLQSDDKKPDAKDAVANAAAKHGGVVVFAPLGEDEAAARLTQEAKRAGVTLAADAAEAVVEEAGTHWGILRSELDKLLLFAKDRKTISREDALACLGYRQSANPFDLPRLVMERKRVQALEVLGRLFEEGLSEFQLLSSISREINRALKARRLRAAGVAEYQLAGQLRMPPFAASKLLQQAQALGEARLIRSLKACVETEAALKSKSWLDPQIELERLVARLTS